MLNKKERKVKNLSKVQVLTGNNFDSFVNSNSFTIIDCWAPWCGPCTILSPIIDELAETHLEIMFGKLNVDENSEISRKFKITAIPTLLFFKNGKLVDTLIGAVPKSIIEDKIYVLT